MIKKLTALFFIALTLQLQAQFRCQEVKMEALKKAGAGPVISIDNRAKSDTIDILHYDLHLDFTEVTQRQLHGHCDIRFTPKLNNTPGISLDLLELTVDSVVLNGQALSYSYNDTILRAAFAGVLNTNDTVLLKVYYHGSPQGDGSGWGGWHSQSGYYYNLGVGFAANPHTYGRAWFPCFDNFVEKSTYDFHFTTVKPLRPYANGLRISETAINGDTILTHWKMTDPIPTYLASVAISNYAEITDNVSGLNGNIPVQLMAKPADSLKIVNSFINLKPTFHALENAFGPYYWQKVGYAVTTVGAMEHATSIHYPVNLVNGNLNGEDIMAHELAHHWWGNLVTCETDADMWINEGMAEFCSHLYAESVYGRSSYLKTVMDNGYLVLDQAHARDNGFKAIQGLTHEYVYGTHVYQKGAMVAHNLRAYLGDSLFFTGLTTLLQNNKYGNLTSNEFRDQLGQITGVNLNAFFDDWVFNPGFPQFSVDSLYTATSGQNNTADFLITQRLRKAPAFYTNIPVFVTFFGQGGDTISRNVIMNGSHQLVNLQNLPFKPVFALAGYNGRLLSGNTYDEHNLNRSGIFSDNRSKMRLTVNSLQDSARIIVMHHWAAPGGKTPAGQYYRLSPQHYWTVKGIDLQNADITGRVSFNRGTHSLDQELVKSGIDSLVVLYREDATREWSIYPYQNRNGFSTAGFIDIQQLKAGDYVLANTAEEIGIEEIKGEKGAIEIYPNPAEGEIMVNFKDNDSGSYSVKMIDAAGKTLFDQRLNINSGETVIALKVSDESTGYVVVTINGIGQKVLLKN